MTYEYFQTLLKIIFQCTVLVEYMFIKYLMINRTIKNAFDIYISHIRISVGLKHARILQVLSVFV